MKRKRLILNGHEAKVVKISAELKDISLEKRTAKVAFATFNNVDKYKDIVMPTFFDKTWKEDKGDIKFFWNHNPYEAPGKTQELFKDNKHAYAIGWFGTHTLGNDVLKMVDEGVATDASFGFKTVRSKMINDDSIRQLIEGKQFEWSVLSAWGANPLSKVQEVNKSFHNNDNIIKLQEGIIRMKKFVRNTTASDGCILTILAELGQAETFIKNLLNTAFTRNANAPKASDEFTDDDDDLGEIDQPGGDGDDIICPECGSTNNYEEDSFGMLHCKACDHEFAMPPRGTGNNSATNKYDRKAAARLIALLQQKV